jgi:hypothetical protein
MDWLQLLNNFGLAVAIVFFLGFSIISTARWLAPRFDKFLDRVLLFLERVTNDSNRLDRLEDRVTAIWDFILRRGSSEVVQKGLGTMNSPLVITDEARSWMKDLAAPLKQFYREVGSKLTPPEFALEVEKKFGDELIQKICIPYGLAQGSCLIIAVQIAQEPDTQLS